jgi:hypothetical protein
LVRLSAKVVGEPVIRAFLVLYCDASGSASIVRSRRRDPLVDSLVSLPPRVVLQCGMKYSEIDAKLNKPYTSSDAASQQSAPGESLLVSDAKEWM